MEKLAKTVHGSLASVSASTNKPLAETFINADVIVIIDTSGSMAGTDGTGRTRYERACDELEKVQVSMPGKIAVISFSDFVLFCPGGVPWYYGQGTDMAKALKFAKVADVPDMRFIVISDGQPDDEHAALEVAKTYTNKIDTIFIGPSGSEGEGFLRRLAKVSGGIAAKDFSAKQLSQSIFGLLAG